MLQASQTPGLVVIAEEDLSKTLLIHKISADNNYQQSGGACTGLWGLAPLLHQVCSNQASSLPVMRACVWGSTLIACSLTLVACAEDTIITWTDSDIGVDVALSFQEVGGCTSVWWVHRTLQHLTPLLAGRHWQSSMSKCCDLCAQDNV